MESRISKLEESVLQLGANNQHSCEVNGEVELLKRRLNQSEQQCLMNDVEIAGVFEANGENTEHVAISLAQILELFERLVYKKRIAYVKDLVTRKVDILAVKETWLREGETGRAPQVTGYRLRHIPRPPSVRTRGGGVDVGENYHSGQTAYRPPWFDGQLFLNKIKNKKNAPVSEVAVDHIRDLSMTACVCILYF
ncbi:unnamed protein product [Leptosia nina]|uniref:Uncharacterized protein n=1 Tax=Leptosia nina TaxID=320188 RepID=A0AAV1IXA2_9NEOP